LFSTESSPAAPGEGEEFPVSKNRAAFGEQRSFEATPETPVAARRHGDGSDLSEFNFKRGLLFLLLLGLAIRAGYFVEHAHTPSFAVPTLDQKYYDTVAKMLLAGEELHTLHGFKPLLYPILLAIFYKVGGAWALPLVVVVQHILGVVSGLIVALLGSRLFGHRLCGLVSGALFVLAPVPLAFEGELLVESAYTFLICFGLLLHLWAAESGGSKSVWLWTLAGALTVLAAQARPNVLVFLVIYPLFAARMWLRSRRIASMTPVLGLAGALLMAIGWGFVNLKQTRSFQLLPSAGGVNLYLGNKRGSKGITAEQERRMSYSDRYQDAIEVWAREEYEAAMRTRGQSPADDPMAVSRYWTGRAVQEIRVDPVAWLGLLTKKCWLSLWNTEIPNNKSLAFLQQESSWLRWLPVRWVILLMLVPAGIYAALNRGNRDALFILVIFAGLYSAANVAFFISDRYRYPVWPVMAVIAGGGLVAFARMIRSRRPAAVLLTVLSMALAAGISLPNWCGIKLPSFARDYLFRSIAWYEKGYFAEALSDASKSLELDGADASAWQQRGNVLYALDRPAEAKENFQQALKLSPGEAVTWNNLGVVNERLGDTNAAFDSFRSATQCDPPSRNAFISLASLQIRSALLPDAEQTLASLQKATCASDPAALALLSVLARRGGDEQRANALETQARSLDTAAAVWALERAGETAGQR
jgi:Tfp pilus assembly protein PilF